MCIRDSAYADRAKIDDYVAGKADPAPAAGGNDDKIVEAVAARIVALVEKTPLYYQDVAAQLGDHDFQTVARALGQLYTAEKLWQDPRGRLCLRDSAFAAKPPARN